MPEPIERVHWANKVRYRDLWRLLRRHGYNCDRLEKNPLWPHNTFRICEQEESESLLALADHPPDQFVHPGVLGGVRLELDNFGLMTREEFNRWVERRAKANAASNGAPADRPARRPRAPRGSA
jgi:hypothetical protein